ncbi:hypothetical protein [Alistipes sp. ZOR0009]|uniref:hypothetical protein n=1 Tax=Alistipes sp. ZOR0009 TaxID=1339253 RepID=UPI0018CCBC7F|nr:hypothetical protein [Alistipes sp. ZOR0009]
MDKLRFYLEFHKSTLVLSWVFSVAVSIVTLSFIVMLIASMSAGPIIGFLYKEMSHKNEYYFYANNGISKISLILVSFFLHVFLGVFLLLIYLYEKHS